MTLTPDRIRAYREDFRAETLGASENGWLSLAALTLICVAAIVAALARLGPISALALLAVPAAWVVANLAEYAIHRGPMHRLGVGLGGLYKRHTSQHHRFFSRELMAIDSARDFRAILFPAWTSLVFVGLVGVPVALVVGWLFSRDVALLFYAASVAYYLAYEWAHLCAHMPAQSVVGQLPLVAFVRSHHAIHHDPAKMRRTNFNFALPLGDWLFGTWER